MIQMIYGRPQDGAWVDITSREPVFHEAEPQPDASTREEKPPEKPMTPEMKHMLHEFP